MATLIFSSDGESDTAAFAARLAPLLRPGDVLCLHGQLGAGKTRLVQGLAAALGCMAEFVASPTFVLVHEYDGPLPLYHVDAYRLRDADEFRDLGGEELAASGGVLCVEWAERIAEALPRDCLHVRITVLGETERRLEVSGDGVRSREVIETLARG